MKLSVRIGKLKLDNPVTVASGTFDYAKGHYNIRNIRTLGAIIPKTVTLNPRQGNPSPRIIETPSGMLNAIGIENPGADMFINTKLPILKKAGIPIIVSISADSDREFVMLAGKFNNIKCVSALELNLSCPNLGKKVLVAQNARATYRVVKAVKKASSIPVIAKLSPNVTDITEIARAAEDAGADAISLINTLTGMAVDIKKRQPYLGNVTGGLSGPAIKPIALSMVYNVAGKVKVPIIAMGGIMKPADALEFLIVGARVVAVGTANFINPYAPFNILSGIKDYMRKNKINDINKIIGSIKINR